MSKPVSKLASDASTSTLHITRWRVRTPAATLALDTCRNVVYITPELTGPIKLLFIHPAKLWQP